MWFRILSKTANPTHPSNLTSFSIRARGTKWTSTLDTTHHWQQSRCNQRLHGSWFSYMVQYAMCLNVHLYYLISLSECLQPRLIRGSPDSQSMWSAVPSIVESTITRRTTLTLSSLKCKSYMTTFLKELVSWFQGFPRLLCGNETIKDGYLTLWPSPMNKENI